MHTFHSSMLFLLYLLSFGAQALEVKVNRPESVFDTRYDYPHNLLQMVLDTTSDDKNLDRVVAADHVMSRNRLLLELELGNKVHVVAEAPKPNWLEKLLVVRIPIRKGLQGYRLFLINQEDQTSISSSKTLKDFMRFPTGSGAGWSTAKVMKDAGFDVVIGNKYDGLFAMLEKRRFLTFGRGINEIGNEYEANKEQFPKLAIESDFAVYTPLPTYFFVSPKMPELAARIRKGLDMLISNGTFDEYFNEHHAALIDQFRLKERKIFTIPNTNLTDEDPVENHKLWFRLSK